MKKEFLCRWLHSWPSAIRVVAGTNWSLDTAQNPSTRLPDKGELCDQPSGELCNRLATAALPVSILARNYPNLHRSGEYSRLYVCFVFSRSAGFCFLQLIIPSTAVVITSWVSLWMENETSFQVSPSSEFLASVALFTTISSISAIPGYDLNHTNHHVFAVFIQWGNATG